MFDDENALVRIDMSEYREQHTYCAPVLALHRDMWVMKKAVSSLKLCAGVLYRVILFDEIEKAHPEVWNALLQILDDGRLTDGQGRLVDFRNTVLHHDQ